MTGTATHARRRQYRTPARPLVGLAVTLTMTLVLQSAAMGAVTTVVNGDFETGTLAGWTVVTQGQGNWFNYTGTSSPASGLPIPAPPQGTRAAITDQNAPTSAVMYQDLVLQPNFGYHLSNIVYYNNRWGSFVTPDNLDITNENQQYRIDLTTTTASPTSTTTGLLANLFRTNVGDPDSLDPTTQVYDLSAFAGQTVRLRYGMADTDSYFQAGVDNVQLFTSPLTTEECKKGGWQTLTDNAGNTFKNQGDCVSWVATGGATRPQDELM